MAAFDRHGESSDFDGYNMRVKPAGDEKPVRFVLDERLDFNHFVPLKKSYIVASSYRSGSNYFCWELWRTGVLGAPVEFLNPYDALPVLMNRFKASSPADYITKLIQRRSSKNGVFGLKTHSHHFEVFLKQYPQLLEALAPVTFIHINRRNKLAQAVSMAKALQTDFWTSRIESERPPVQYDRELIAKCLEEVEQQELKWPRWFEAHNIEPFRVVYEDLIADTPKVIRKSLSSSALRTTNPIMSLFHRPSGRVTVPTGIGSSASKRKNRNSGTASLATPGTAVLSPAPMFAIHRTTQVRKRRRISSIDTNSLSKTCRWRPTRQRALSG